MGPAGSGSGLSVPTDTGTMDVDYEGSRKPVKPVPYLMPVRVLGAVTVPNNITPSRCPARRPITEGRGSRASHSKRPRRSLPLQELAVSHWSKMNQSSCQKVGQYYPRTRGPGAFVSPWNIRTSLIPPRYSRCPACLQRPRRYTDASHWYLTTMEVW